MRQLWLHGYEAGRDIVDAVERGRELIEDAPPPRLPRIDWGLVHAAFWFVALAVITALVLTGGVR